MELLLRSVQQGDLKSLVELLSKNPSGISAFDESGQSILHYACALGQHTLLHHMLSLSTCKIFQKDQIYGYSSLHIACLFNEEKVVNVLLCKAEDKDDSIDAQDNFGWTALHHAARNGNLSICKKLVACSARLDILNSVSKTACHYAAEHGHLDVIKYLFDYNEQQLTPPVITELTLVQPTLFHAAALNNHLRVVEWLTQRAKPYPPLARYRRIINFDNSRSRDELPEDVASTRGHLALRSFLCTYRRKYENWIEDICQDRITLDRIKFCICGHPRVGKSALRQSLCRPYLQKLLGRDVKETEEEDVDRCTFGIEITSLQLSGRDLFSVWDFAGQIESFVTHHFFISTQSTVFAVLVDITSSIDDQRAQLLRWLGFIKVRNLGQVPFSRSLKEIERNFVLTAYQENNTYIPISPMKASCHEPKPNPSGNSEKTLSQSTMYGTVLQQVPVIIVGSHYDQIAVQGRDEIVSNTQSLVMEMKNRFEKYLAISPQVYPVNCLKAVSSEISAFKEHLCEIRSNLLELQPKYPRVVELVARKIESLRLENPKQKVLSWKEMKCLVRDEINGLVSEKQLALICKCLADAGVLVYFQEGALANYVFIDPGWLCQDVLGKALAPGSFPVSQIASIGSSRIPIDVLQHKFSDHIDSQYIFIIIELLQHFDLCRQIKSIGILEFPALLSESLCSAQIWLKNSQFVYCGRRLSCADDTDSFPPGFFCRFQVQVCNILKQDEIVLFKGSIVLIQDGFECLVKINDSSTAIDLIGRASINFAIVCSQLLDQIQGILSKLIRDACPTIFLELQIVSASDLRSHIDSPSFYDIGEVIAAVNQVVNKTTGHNESCTDLLYFGDVSLQKLNSGKNTRIAYIPCDVILKIQDLLQDGQQDWRSLAKSINLEQYIQLLESKSPDSTRLLLLKWGEKPKWKVQNLLYALRNINRMDVYSYLEARVLKM